MRDVRRTSKFKKDMERCKRRRLDLSLLKEPIKALSEGRLLDLKYKDHSLTGAWKDHRDFHLFGDWLVIYQIEPGTPETLVLVRTGTHSDIFR